MTDIRLSTAPNGYSLKIGGNEFFYFNELDLLAGFIARIGSGKTEEMEKEDILNTMFNVMLGEKYARDIDVLNKTVERLTTKYNERIDKLEGLITIVNDAISKHKTMKEQLEDTTKKVNTMRECYAEALKPFKEYNDRITKLESDTMRIEGHFNVATQQADNQLKYIDDRINKLSETEKLLNSKARMLVEKLDMRLRILDTLDEGAESPAVDEKTIEASNRKDREKKAVKIDEKPKKKMGRPKKTGGDTKTTRQERDAAIMAKMNENPNIK